MKKIAVSLLIISAALWLTPAIASPPPPPPHVHGGMGIHAGYAPPPHMRMHHRPHGAVSFGMANAYGMSNYAYTGARYYCPCYGVCRPFRHPGPQYSSSFYISF